MKPKSNILTLIIIIILLVIFLPCAVMGTIFHRQLVNDKANKESLGSCDINLGGGSCYHCDNSGYCGFALNYIKDDTYNYNYYKDAKGGYVSASGDYFFLVDATNGDKTYNEDDTDVIIYNKNNETKVEIHGINNYNVGILGNIYIAVDDNEKYALLKISGSTISKITEYDYDFIGVHNYFTEDGKLDGKRFLAYKGNTCFIIDNEGKVLSNESYSPIYDYNDEYIIYSENNSYVVKDYSGLNYDMNQYKMAKFIGKYLVTTDQLGITMVIDTKTKAVASKSYNSSDGEVEVSQNEGKVSIYVNGNEKETLDLN